MKQVVLFSAIGVLASMGTVANAEEMGRVISSTPVIQQVAVPRQVCGQPVAVQQQPSSGGGALVGAIVGGLLGNTVGHGMGRAAATGVGVVAGAAIGDNVEGRSQPQAVQQCSTQTFYENRTISYNVVYEYAGKQYNVQLPYDPGQSIRLQVSPVGAGAAPMPPGPGTAQPVIVAPPVVQAQPVETVTTVAAAPVAYPAYPAYYSSYYAPYYRPSYVYPPVSLSLGFGYSSGWGHRHWR